VTAQENANQDDGPVQALATGEVEKEVGV